MTSLANILSVPEPTTTVSEEPTAAEAFVDSVGIVTHFTYFGTPYVDDFSKVKSQLGALGVRHIRDSIDSQNWSEYVPRFEELEAMGLHLDAGTLINDTPSTIRAGLARLPQFIEAVEAPNEYDLHGGSNWAEQLRTFQKMLYETVKAAPHGSSYAVNGPSITSYRDSIKLGNLSEYLDQGTMHDYFGAQNPGTVGGTPFPVGKYNSLQFWIGTGRLIGGSKPLVTTETGYEDLPSIPNHVPPSVKARYTVRELLLQWNAHIRQTYFYELVDEGGQSLGFIDASLKPKPVYFAVQNLLSKLADPGPSFTLKPLTYSLTAASTVAHSLLQKRDGSYRFMCWNEVVETDPKVPSEIVIIKPDRRFRTVTQYLWQDDGSVRAIALAQKSNDTITFTATDRLSEIEMLP